MVSCFFTPITLSLVAPLVNVKVIIAPSNSFLISCALAEKMRRKLIREEMKYLSMDKFG
jgi:hypothetical protein